MNYSTQLLATKPDCQALINIANSEKEALAYRKTGLDRKRQSVSLTAAEIQTELASVTAELDALQAVYDSLPAGPTKDDTLVKFRKVEYKKFLLEQRKSNYGVLSVLEKEYDISCIEKDIAETDAYILALTERMNAIQ
jgi:hypothetical protein